MLGRWTSVNGRSLSLSFSLSLQSPIQSIGQRLESSPVITEPVCEGSYKVRMGVSRAGEDIKEPT